jgi:hypothetical protein
MLLIAHRLGEVFSLPPSGSAIGVVETVKAWFLVIR